MTITVLQQQSIAMTQADWSASLPFNQFDPSTGTLQDALFTTTGMIDASASIENLAPIAATIDLGVGADIDASVSGIGGVASISPLAVASVDLPAFQGTFDGTADFTAPSGTILPHLLNSASQTTLVNVGTAGGGSPLVGTGTFDVNVTSSGLSTVDGNGNLAVLLHDASGATVSLQYQAASSPVGSSDSEASTSIYFDPLTPWRWFANAVTTTPQVVTLPSQTTGWTADASFAQFNPSLGTLDAIILSAANTLTSTFAAENLGQSGGLITMNETAFLTVTSPGDGGLTANVPTRDWLELSGYDGTTDFSGSSGQTDNLGPYLYEPAGAQLMDGTDLAAFTGGGTITLPVATAGTSVVSGTGDLFTELTQQTGGTVSVSYVYTPFSGQTPGSVLGTASSSAHGVVNSFASVSPDVARTAQGLTFIGGFGSGFVAASPNETFMIGAGANAYIGNFSPTAGDRLNLSALLAGAPLASDLSKSRRIRERHRAILGPDRGLEFDPGGERPRRRGVVGAVRHGGDLVAGFVERQGPDPANSLTRPRAGETTGPPIAGRGVQLFRGWRVTGSHLRTPPWIRDICLPPCATRPGCPVGACCSPAPVWRMRRGRSARRCNFPHW